MHFVMNESGQAHEDIEDLCSIYDGKLVRVRAVRTQKGFFALKSVPVAQSLSLQREWAILQRLSHSHQHSDCANKTAHFLRGVDYWLSLDGERANLLLELAEGGPLHRHIHAHGDGLPVHRARMYTFELVDALLFLHERCRCIHRDLKASNVLLDARGHAKLCDFGAAKIFSARDERAYTIIGTLHAMAPEIVSRDVGYGFGVDWWALGVLVYEMLTGRPPAFTWHFQESMHSHSRAETKENTEGRVWERLVSEEQSQKARRKVIGERMDTDSDWDFVEVNELLSFYPYPPMPTGDILNNIAVIERRLAHEAVLLAEEFISDLLCVQPQHRRIPTQRDIDENKISWLQKPRENEDIEFDRRWGVGELLRSSLSVSKTESHTERDIAGETDPFLDF